MLRFTDAHPNGVGFVAGTVLAARLFEVSVLWYGIVAFNVPFDTLEVILEVFSD